MSSPQAPGRTAQILAAKWLQDDTPRIAQDRGGMRAAVQGPAAPGTAPEVHRDDCGTCQCDYLDQQARVSEQILDHSASLERQIRELRQDVQEDKEYDLQHWDHIIKQIGLLWRVTEDMQKKFGGGRSRQ